MLQLLRNADVYAPTPLGRCDVLVGDERVLYVGAPLDTLPSQLAVTVVDLEGQRLIPGLIDGHVHITGGGGESGAPSRVPAPLLSQYTLGGVTSVVGLLGTDDLTRSTGTLVTQARALCDEGLSAWCYTGGYHLPLTTLTGSVRGDVCYIDRIIGVGELALSDHRSSQPTLDELLRVASEAHVAGLMTGKAGTVHLHLGDGARGLALVRDALRTSELPPRVFHPTHVNRRRALFDEALALTTHGCTIDITAFPVADDEDAWRADDALVRALEAGVPVERLTVSSDGGGCLPVFDADGRVAHMDVGRADAMATTLAALLARGQELARVLPAFTQSVATLLRLPRKGSIAVGADADLVVLDAAHRVCHVMARGQWHVREGRAERRGLFEAASDAETTDHSHRPR
jgi:beta-aspartyl-dipeptidase (metallo-type)